MRDLNDLQYFAAVVEHGGFSQAGRSLGVQKSRLSRRVLQLEERLGVRLLNRSSRRFSVTDIGREFYDRCVAMLIEAEAAEQIVAEAQSQPRGLVRLSCPTALLSIQFGALLARFMVQHPGVHLNLESTNRRVDVIAEGFDLAIRVRPPPLEPTDLVLRRLDDSSQCLVAAPALLKDAAWSVGDLHALPSLDWGPPRREHAWTLHHANGETSVIPHAPRLVTDDVSALREAAIAGVGAVRLPTIFIFEDVRAGRLVNVVPDWRPQSGLVHAVFPSRRGLLPSVRTLLEFLARECAIDRRQADLILPPPDTIGTTS